MSPGVTRLWTGFLPARPWVDRRRAVPRPGMSTRGHRRRAEPPWPGSVVLRTVGSA